MAGPIGPRRPRRTPPACSPARRACASPTRRPPTPCRSAHPGGQIAVCAAFLRRTRDDLVDTQTDIYSLGILAYELMTGVPPRENARAGAWRDRAEAILDLRPLDALWNRDLGAVIEHARGVVVLAPGQPRLWHSIALAGELERGELQPAAPRASAEGLALCRLGRLAEARERLITADRMERERLGVPLPATALWLDGLATTGVGSPTDARIAFHRFAIARRTPERIGSPTLRALERELAEALRTRR